MPLSHRVLLFDDPGRADFFPLSVTRPIAELTLGIDRIADSWSRLLDAEVRPHVPEELGGLWAHPAQSGDWFINSCWLPDPDTLQTLESLQPGMACRDEHGRLIAARCAGHHVASFQPWAEEWATTITRDRPTQWLNRLWDLTAHNAAWICRDYEQLTAHRRTAAIHDSNRVIGGQGVFLEKDAVVVASVLDDREGPIYLGERSEVMPGCLIRGPFSLGAGSVLKMGAKIYGGTSVGPGCRVGGEVSQSILQAYSNKGHDGFLGHSVIGSWCNLGADTNNSNLKNDYGPVKVFNHRLGQLEDSGTQFCGLFMGDHSKCGINTMFNTGTVVGVSANIFGSGFPPKFVPSFAWGGGSEWSTYRFDKAAETMRRVMARRQKELTPDALAVLEAHFHSSAAGRYWESPLDRK